MKRILLTLVLLYTTIAQSQEKTFEKEVAKISKRIEMITKQQKDSLKTKVVAIDKQLENGEITDENASILKKEAADYHAKKIELLVSEQERLLQLLVQDKTNGKIASADDFFGENEDYNTFTIGNTTFRFNVSDNDDDKISRKEKKWRYKNPSSRRTSTQFVFAMGINNVLENNQFNSLNDSEYELWRSRFYELGWTWKTRFSKEPSQLYFKYGVSFLWNNLRLEDNQVHEKNGDITNIVTYPNQLSESRLRHVQMNFPMHVEWDLSKNKTNKEGKVLDRRNESFRIGLGGFVGFKLGTRQYLEYQDNNGVAITELQKNNFNMNTVNYGISSYIGYKSTSLYVKYDLNPLFQDTNTRNISMGIRLDLD
ncbi:hypothetical protein [Polaribacter gangjinensis]|uniref:Outer membrane protein beta-barrel domain-containing protein n=1 Tax=Polaribacter gangjinensis TaxID=574710 RepID=A0A2S7W9G2_9FLAO|nr:hypothetical protein [Polaribacter gangjinensis]PQJ74239.1 hypothetical protein BTO13_02655 [Polaribacter gangjinensis]